MAKTADLPSLLATSERAVFHGAPGKAVADLEQAVGLAQSEGLHAEVAAAAWLLGVALTASGRYGAGLRVLVPLLEAGEARDASTTTAELKLFSSLAGGTAASVHRGLGRAEAAMALDARGLSLTDGPGEAAFDCLLGLAADAVGAGRADEAKKRFTQASAVIEGHGGDWWRQKVRLEWVRAEIAMLAGRPSEARAAAVEAVAGAERARAPRHVSKGLLFQGVAELQSGEGDAAATLRRAATLAEGLGALPLVWQSRALLGALLGAGNEEAARSLAAARNAVLTIAADLPAELRDEWLARPNVSALLEG
ncbi:MAG TPA: hypothetical protein VG899_11135 [Mycobacteriales bacterium]|nr:hypothetical protein [Mycobacteriales bacterium]